MKIAFLICFLVVFVHSSVLVPKKDNVFGIDLSKPGLDQDEVAFARGRSSEEDSDSSSSESDSNESGEKPTTTRRTTTTKRTTTARPTTTTRRPTTTRRTTTTRTTTTKRTTTTTTRPTTTRATPKPTTTTTTTPKPTTTPPPPPTTTEFPSDCKIRCRTPIDHYLVNPANCNSFYQCSNMTPIYQPCPPNLVFNPSINVCVTKDMYHCVETCDRVEVLYRTKAG